MEGKNTSERDLDEDGRRDEPTTFDARGDGGDLCVGLVKGFLLFEL